jgi:putative nucleotidyltransferase with HDIG domain
LTRIEEHDRGLFEHVLLAGAIASLFALAADLPPDQQRVIVTGTLLHDVGKLKIASGLLHKAGPLTQAERKEMERHPEYGLNMLQHGDWDPEVLDIVHLHHERLDGSGYPGGLRADKIGKLVRMVTLCDVFSALIEERSYRPRPRQPLEIMRVMDTELDLSLLALFSQSVPAFAYRAQRLLKVQVDGGLFAIPVSAVQSHNVF